MKAQILLNNQMSMKQHYNEEFLCRKMIWNGLVSSSKEMKKFKFWKEN
jgi:hypothetical protein